jgi:hexosaminidase
MSSLSAFSKFFLTSISLLFVLFSSCLNTEQSASNAPTGLLVGDAQRLIPWPSSVELRGGALWVFDSRQVQAELDLSDDADDRWGAEGYQLEIDSSGAHITAATEAGLFYGRTTLRQLRPTLCEGDPGCPNGYALPALIIEDAPAFAHRGLLLDCCRHFMSVDFVKHTIDALALHKMNVLHWHLTEDQGWRVEIDAYPDLTLVGSQRINPDGTPHGGYYTKSQIREIVAYAAERHIEVIPEIELPGHSRAALAAYPWLSCTGDTLPVANRWGVFKDIYCAGNDSTLAFLRAVLDEVVELFPSTRVHIGGDEAPKVRWEACPKCNARIAEEGLHDAHDLQRWFIEQMGDHLATRGRTIVGWDEILEGGLPRGATVQSWRGMAGAEQGVALGADVVVSPTSHCYLDYPLRSTDLEEIYSFDPAPPALQRGPGHVLGGECNMWSEHAPEHLVDSKVYPRAIGLAEVLWSGRAHTARTGAYDEFLARLDGHYPRLDDLGVNYGLETVPVALTLAPASATEGSGLAATVSAAMRQISGEVSWRTSGGETSLGPLDTPFTVEGLGELHVQLTHRGKPAPEQESFFVAAHLGAFSDLVLDYEPSQHYTAGGLQALADGRRGSLDFRDGAWQAVQGEPMIATIDLGSTLPLERLSARFYHYQDAWIFTPSQIHWSTSLDGNSWTSASNWISPAMLAPDSVQDIRSHSSDDMGGRLARYVKMEAANAGPCPDWHAAAGQASWLFCDEIVVE